MYNANADCTIGLHFRQLNVDEQTKTTNKTLTCIECKNETELQNEQKVGDVVECDACGIEYEVKEAGEEYTLALIEEEK